MALPVVLRDREPALPASHRGMDKDVSLGGDGSAAQGYTVHTGPLIRRGGSIKGGKGRKTDNIGVRQSPESVVALVRGRSRRGPGPPERRR